MYTSKCYFTPLKKSNKLLNNTTFYTIDFECHPISKKFRLGCICKYYQNNYYTYAFYSEKEIFDFLVENKVKILYCYNIAFDMTFILNEIAKRKYEFFLIQSNQAILGMTFAKNKEEMKKNAIQMKDFFCFTHTSLEYLSEVFKTENKKYPNLKSKEEYEEFFNTCNDEELEKHCIQDVKILAECINIFRNTIFNEFAIDFFKNIYSLASLSIKIFRTNFMTEKIENSIFELRGVKGKRQHIKLKKELYDSIMSSYSGGYCDVFDSNIQHDLVCFDINSSYPFQMTKIQKFPCGKGYLTENLQLFEDFAKDIPTICFCKIHFNNKYFIPVKSEVKLKRVKDFEGWITSLEYFYLKEKNVDVRFIKGYYFVDYDKSHSLYSFASTIYNKRKNTDNDIMKFIYKIILNSLYGKFAQKVHSKSKQYKIIDEKIDIESEYVEIKLSDEISIAEITTEKECKKTFMFPLWSSLITASGRLQLLEMIHNTNAVYCDTDSVYAKKENCQSIQDSKELGGWKLEKEIREFRAIAPKVYAYTDIKDNKEIKMKGVSKNIRSELYDKILNFEYGSEIETKEELKYLTFKQILKMKNNINKSDLFNATTLTNKCLKPKLK